MSFEWAKKVVLAFVGAAIAIPTVAGGYYLLYQLVTFLQN